MTQRVGTQADGFHRATESLSYKSHENQSPKKTATESFSTPTKTRTVSYDPSYLVSPATERVKNLFKSAPLPSPEAATKALEARRLQKFISVDGSLKDVAELKVALETDCYITADKLFLTRERAGKGAASEAFFADEIEPSAEPSNRPKKVVLKRSQSRQLKDEEDLTRNIQLSSPSKRRKLNYVEDVYQFPLEDKRIGIYQACKGDLNHIEYPLDTPASYVLPILRDIAEGLLEISRHHISHRDIKGANLLVTQEGGGSIGDFGLARIRPNRNHTTALTPHFAAPFIWRNILGQKYRNVGYQGEAADVFALGVTLQIDVFPRMLIQLARHYKIKIGDKLSQIKPMRESVDPKWSDEELLKKEEEYKKIFQRVIYSANEKGANLFLFKPRRFILGQILECINLFEPHINPQELAKMRALAQLMHDLQDSIPQNLSAIETLNRFNALIHAPEESATSSSGSSMSICAPLSSSSSSSGERNTMPALQKEDA